MNVVALAHELMETRAEITNLAELHQLVMDLLALINPWEKYTRPGQRAAGDRRPTKKLRMGTLEEVDEEEEKEEEEEEEHPDIDSPSPSRPVDSDEHRQYMLSKYQALINGENENPTWS